MSTKQLLVNKGITLRCPTCKRQWMYKGNRIYYTGCSNCHRSIHIRNNMVTGPLAKSPITNAAQHPDKELISTA